VADFETTAFVLRSGLISVFIAEMNFNASELILKSIQNPVEIGLNQVGEFVVHGDVLIAADLNLHSLNSFSLTCAVRRLECYGSGQILAVEGLAGCAKLFSVRDLSLQVEERVLGFVGEAHAQGLTFDGDLVC